MLAVADKLLTLKFAPSLMKGNKTLALIVPLASVVQAGEVVPWKI